MALLKQTLSPFNGTALDQYLRNMDIENLVLAGVTTNGAVETTARNAGDRGFNAIVAADACAAFSPDDEEAGTQFASWYIVRSVREIIDELAPFLAPS
jgi:nicotinamidase-related amidase